MKHERVESNNVVRTVVYAIGGNALSSPTGRGEEESALVLAKVMSDVIDLLEAGWRVILTHGNGPQVGHLMSLDASQPMADWVAATQGIIGHSISINLDSILRRRNRPESTAVILTRVEVESGDSAFEFPTKPVGPILSDMQMMTEDWDIAETINGPRRVVASPKPISIIDSDAIEALLLAGAVVLCGGGGGIPVIADKGGIKGIEAVIDKDRVSALLATSLNADYLFISTAVDSIKIDFGTEKESNVSSLSVSDATIHLKNGQFPVGSMGPKVEAMIFAKESAPQMKVVLCKPGDAIDAMRGEVGTTIV